MNVRKTNPQPSATNLGDSSTMLGLFCHTTQFIWMIKLCFAYNQADNTASNVVSLCKYNNIKVTKI